MHVSSAKPLAICTEDSCKKECKKLYPKQCTYKLGKVVATCKKIYNQPITQRPVTVATAWQHPRTHGAPMCSSNGVCLPAK